MLAYPELIIICVMSFVTFVMFGLDKLYAVRNRWRIQETVLLLFSFFGGAFGALCGMKIFRHKTRHPKFIICVPLFLVLHIAIEVVLRVLCIL